MKEVYEGLHKFADKLLGIMGNTSSKEEFLSRFNESSFDSLRDHLGYCFYKVNEIAYNFLEKNEKPDEILQLLGFSIASIANKVELWDGENDSPFYAYSEFGKGNLSKEIALEILKNQKAIENFGNTIYYIWSEVHERGVFTKLKDVA